MKNIILGPKIQNQIVQFCYAHVGHMFAMMHNPKYRGPLFTWIKFPEMMRESCRVQVFISVDCSKNKEAKCGEYAAQTGFVIASTWVATMME